ncbi:unnamed protein product [Rotaria sp. Silwood2]|nr:unnamed protein product [Rotaria sp. Silwood2]CAF3096152.1 unnamed protein product [Rotaria sp. Silwood2]CAF3252154.1 unnamed protein product [Rotaria sp. Silwood2]CAF4126455.1 unnamed protein product [Rotaria sp. Silwood2]CAF4180194.1 unnamed protein product [Rotaria sp. Silwood2]
MRPSTNITSPTPSTVTATDISTASTPVMAIERQNIGRAPTVHGQIAANRKKLAFIQIQDDDYDEEQFKKLSNRQKTKNLKI